MTASADEPQPGGQRLPGPLDEGIERREARFYGRVQGVGFRYTTQRTAAHFPVTGFVQNLPDGSVRLVAEGEPHQLDRFLGDLDDRLGRYIESREITVRPSTGEFREFEIRS